MIIPKGRTLVSKPRLVDEEWGVVVYFVHHIESGRYLIHDDFGVRIFCQNKEDSWSDAYYELVED